MQIVNLDESSANVDIKEVDLDISALSKSGYPHYMLKEIFEQPHCIENSMRGRIVAVVTEADEAVKRIAQDLIEIPSTLDCLEPLLSVLPMQMLAYHVAVRKGLNVDMPRNLAKSVTVE